MLETLEYIKHETDVWLELTTLLIPGENDSDEELHAMTKWVVEKLGPDVPIAGSNGARNGTDVARFLLAGASAVQVATSVITDGWDAIARMVAQLRAYLEGQGVNARDIVGEAADSSISYEEAAVRSRA